MYIFERLSFGFENAPAHFQRCVQTIVDKGDAQVVIYLDNTVVFGDSPDHVWAETIPVI